ncbi:MAG TPA: permease prefix domain 1-containing protein, partial [Blastocatellia bacterium]|nr:permease prefix domain 1-containing protein [Blastocatellia bacterium]
MSRLRVFIHRLRAIFFKGRLERDLEDELRAHIEMQEEDYRQQGMSPEEARYAALRKFGGVEQVKEAYRDRRGIPLVESVLHDLRYGLRMMRKYPGFTLVAVLTLALGIGANTAIFSVVDSVLLRQLPYPEAERLVFLWSTMNSQGVPISGSSMPDYREWRDQNRSFDGVAGFYYGDFNLSTSNGEPERVQGA